MFGFKQLKVKQSDQFVKNTYATNAFFFANKHFIIHTFKSFTKHAKKTKTFRDRIALSFKAYRLFNLSRNARFFKFTFKTVNAFDFKPLLLKFISFNYLLWHLTFISRLSLRIHITCTHTILQTHPQKTNPPLSLSISLSLSNKTHTHKAIITNANSIQCLFRIQ